MPFNDSGTPFVGKLTGAQDQALLVAGTALKVTRIKSIIVTASAATTFRLQDNGTVPKALTAIHEMVAGVPLTLPGPYNTNPGNGITGSNSAGNVAIEFKYTTEP
jgi:hypothetical protein